MSGGRFTEMIGDFLAHSGTIRAPGISAEMQRRHREAARRLGRDAVRLLPAVRECFHRSDDAPTSVNLGALARLAPAIDDWCDRYEAWRRTRI